MTSLGSHGAAAGASTSQTILESICVDVKAEEPMNSVKMTEKEVQRSKYIVEMVSNILI